MLNNVVDENKIDSSKVLVQEQSLLSKFSLLNSLPLELKIRTVSFLSSNDAVTLTESFGKLLGIYVNTLQPPMIITHRQVWMGDLRTGDIPKPSTYILPILNNDNDNKSLHSSSKIPYHSITMTFRWKDQGWGNLKGQLYIIASNIKKKNDNDDDNDIDNDNIDDDDDDDIMNDHAINPFRGGRCVWESGIAPHDYEDMEITFPPPNEDEIYTLWYKPGGGGGHVLHIENCKLHYTVYDDEEYNYTYIYQRLHDLGVLQTSINNQSSSTSRSNNAFATAFGFIHDLTGNDNNSSSRQQQNSSVAPDTNNFYTTLLVSVCKSLTRQLKQQQEEEPEKGNNNNNNNDGMLSILDPDLVDFCNKYEIPIKLKSLQIVQELVEAKKEIENLYRTVQQQQEEAQQRRRRQAAPERETRQRQQERRRHQQQDQPEERPNNAQPRFVFPPGGFMMGFGDAGGIHNIHVGGPPAQGFHAGPPRAAGGAAADRDDGGANGDGNNNNNNNNNRGAGGHRGGVGGGIFGGAFQVNGDDFHPEDFIAQVLEHAQPMDIGNNNNNNFNDMPPGLEEMINNIRNAVEGQFGGDGNDNNDDDDGDEFDEDNIEIVD